MFVSRPSTTNSTLIEIVNRDRLKTKNVFFRSIKFEKRFSSLDLDFRWRRSTNRRRERLKSFQNEVFHVVLLHVLEHLFLLIWRLFLWVNFENEKMKKISSFWFSFLTARLNFSMICLYFFFQRIFQNSLFTTDFQLDFNSLETYENKHPSAHF